MSKLPNHSSEIGHMYSSLYLSSIGTGGARPLDQLLTCVTFCLRQKLTGLAPDLVIPTPPLPILQFQHQMLTVYE